MQKEMVLNYLERSRGSYVSGGDIARALGVSRNSVWKVIKSLEEQGYKFKKSTRLGYMLLEENDELTISGVTRYLKDGYVRKVEIFEILESTNSYLMQKASLGEEGNLLVIARTQSGGRGRKGRSFHSPSGGVYFSVLLRPSKEFKGAPYLTCMAAVSVMDAIKEVYGVECGIKWVNDIYIGDRKCAGILTEATIDFESGSISHAVVGVGINVKEPSGGFPKEIRDIACAIGKECPDGKNRLIGAVVNNLMDTLNCFEYDQTQVMDRYREGSMLIGRKVLVKRDTGDKRAKCLGITDEGYLEVEYSDGTKEELFFGEVSLKL
ncbi:MAG: biotin--[Clostridia bacterium]|nr:biotin--[acetyl-CoA-carboxylase] ligase [Clostridia bacterium]